MAAVSGAVALARTDCDATRQLLVLLATGRRALDRFEEERSCLSGTGLPAGSSPAPVSSAATALPAGVPQPWKRNAPPEAAPRRRNV